MQKKSLGKGLDALISGAARRWDPPVAPAPAAAPTGNSAQADDRSVVELAKLDAIVSSPMQPRKTFRDDNLDELMESIREHGLIQPLIVRKVKGKYELIAGERRFRASQKLGLTEIPVIVREATDRDVLEMALIENLQREDLNPMEEAEAYSRLAKEFNMKQEEIATRVGKKRATIANSVRLLDLTDDVKSLLAQARITTGHAKAILGLRDPALQSMVADMVVRLHLTVRQTEKQVQMELEGRKTNRDGRSVSGKSGVKMLDPHFARIQNRLREHLATQVQIHHGEKKGKIEIEYYGDEDLTRVLEVLGIESI